MKKVGIFFSQFLLYLSKLLAKHHTEFSCLSHSQLTKGEISGKCLRKSMSNKFSTISFQRKIPRNIIPLFMKFWWKEEKRGAEQYGRMKKLNSSVWRSAAIMGHEVSRVGTLWCWCASLLRRWDYQIPQISCTDQGTEKLCWFVSLHKSWPFFHLIGS